MGRRRHTAERIIGKLRTAEIELAKGLGTAEVVRKLGITEQTYYRWRKEYGGLRLDQAKRLKELEKENTRLKKLVSRPGARQRDPQGSQLGKILSPARRRCAVEHVYRVLGVSERRACRVRGQARSTQRHRVGVDEGETRLVARIIELAKAYGRYGYRRITALLHREGWRVNHKKVERIWREEGLKVPRKQPKRGRLWWNDGSCVRKRAKHRDHVWSHDFVFDRTHDGRPLRMLTMVDEYTRECLTIDVSRQYRSEQVLDRLAELFVERGAPTYLRSDNGSEFTATAVREWLAQVGVKTLFIEPGSPWENGYVESFNGKLRDELLNGETFYTLQEAQVIIEEWKREYNTFRPHSSLGYRPPAPETVQGPWPRDEDSLLGLT